MMKPTPQRRALFFLLFDALLSLMTLYSAYLLRFNFEIPTEFTAPFLTIYLTLFLFKIVAMSYFRIYLAVWRFFALSDARNLLLAHVAAYGAFTVLFLFYSEPFSPFARSVIIIDFILSFLMLGFLRFFKRLVLTSDHAKTVKPALIIGVNAKTSTMINSARSGDILYQPVAIIAIKAENADTIGTYIQNIKVYEQTALETLLGLHTIQAALITAELDPPILKALVQRLNSAGISDIKISRILGSRHDRLDDLSIEDLLARRPKDLDTTLIASFIEGKRLMITGAGGSIGSEIARQCDRFNASELILVDNGEYNLYAIGEALPHAQLHLLSVTARETLENLISRTRPQIIIHAAAYKHVPLCEANPDAAVRNNVLGTKNVIDLSIEYGVQKVVIVSTDKAVRPTNIMGATKRIGELYAQNVEAGTTEIVAVRFGNVLGSSGSVIPKFKSQIEAGGPVTVTHPEITRYFMLISEACQLVLQAAAIAEGGELFILDMGEPIKIADLARQMIHLYGKEDEIEIVYSGLRAGEKLYEELLIDESEQKTAYASITIARSTPYPIDKLESEIATLLASEPKRQQLKAIVPEYTYKT